MDTFFFHKNMSSIFYRKYIRESIAYEMSPSYMFHFLQMYVPENGGFIDKYDTRYVRTVTTSMNNNFNENNLNNTDHWVFDNCIE